MNSHFTPMLRTILCLAILLALTFSTTRYLDPVTNAQGQVQVSAADPAATEQGTLNLNVKVTGKGFKNGAKAKWFVTGTTDPGGVTVNSTTFVSSSEVTANITVADTASVANFDIQVLNSDGRGGKGTELFAVISKGNGNNTTCPPRLTTPCLTGSGCLDSSFNGTGQVVNDIAGGTRAVLAQNDGKIIAVGKTISQVFVARYTSSGTLDTTGFGDLDSFGNRTGITSVSLLNTVEMYAGGGAIYQDASGDTKILAAGYTKSSTATFTSMFVIRFNSDGTLDTTFGDIDPITSLRTGKKLIQIGTSANTGVRGIAVQLVAGSPQIYLGGYANGQGAVFRLRNNGDLDPSFNGQGYINLNQSAVTIALQPNGRIVAGGWVTTSRKGNDFALTRLSPLGQPDSTFGSNGQVTTDFFGYSESIESIAVDSVGKIVAVGEVVIAKGPDMGRVGIARYSSAGQLEVKNIASYLDSGVKSVVVQPDGKLVTLAAHIDCSWGLAVTRFNGSDLSVDTTFGSNGSVFTGYGESGATSAMAYSMTIQIDPACGCPKIVASGSAETGGVYHASLIRFVP